MYNNHPGNSSNKPMNAEEHQLFTKLLGVIKKINSQMRKIETLRVEIISLVPTITHHDSREQMLKLYCLIQMENEKLYNLIQEGMDLEKRESEGSRTELTPPLLTASKSNDYMKGNDYMHSEPRGRPTDYENRLSNGNSGKISSCCSCGMDSRCPGSRMSFSASNDKPHKMPNFRPMNLQQDTWYEPLAATFSKSCYRFKPPNTMTSQITFGGSDATLKNFNRNGSILNGSKSSSNILECLRKNKICDVSDIKVLDDVNYFLANDGRNSRPSTSQMRSSRSHADFFGSLARQIASQNGKIEELFKPIHKKTSNTPSKSPAKK